MLVSTSQLSPSQKAALEELMGRKLGDEETIRIHAFSEPEPSSSEHQAAVEKFRKFLEQLPPSQATEDEMNEAILEAMREVRGPGYTEVR